MRTLLTTVLLVVPALATPCAQVAGPQVRAGDLAAVVPELQSGDAAASLGLTPLPGARRVFTPADLSRLGVRIEQPVCVERATAPLRAEAVALAVSTALPGAEVVSYSQEPVPQGTLEFDARRLPTRSGLADGLVRWPGRLVYDGQRSLPVWAMVRLSGKATPQAPAGGDPSGRSAVRAGDALTVRVVSGQATLLLEARAEGNAEVGQALRCRRADGGKVFVATVQAPGLALLELTRKESSNEDR